MAEPGGVRSSWGKGLPSSRHYEPESESRRYEAPVFVPHSPSMATRRHSVSAANLAETLKQRNMVPIASLQKSRDRLSSTREDFLELRQEVIDLEEYDKAYEKAKMMNKQDAQSQQSVYGSQGAIQEAHSMSVYGSQGAIHEAHSMSVYGSQGAIQEAHSMSVYGSQGAIHEAHSMSVYGSQGAIQEAQSKTSERRRRMSLGSQMELIQGQLESHSQSRPKSVIGSSVTPRARSFIARTTPSSRSNSVPKARPFDDSEIPYPPATARALQFDRVCESLPNFKPSEVKPDFNEDTLNVALTSAGSLVRSPPVINCLPNVRTVSKSESNTPVLESPRAKQSTPTKYLNARAVAERLAKVIRGGTKSSKNKVSMPCPESPRVISENKCVDPEAYSRHCNPEQALDQSVIYADFNEKSQISSFRERITNPPAPREEKEIDLLKNWLEGMKGEGVYDDLEKKAKATCERLELLDDEQAMLDDRQLCLNDFQLRSSDTIAAVQQRLRRMHEEKKYLALEAAAELRRRISERSAARKVFALMKREMDAYAKVMEKEKVEMQSKVQEEIARRESSWAGKLDRVRSEERELRERVMNLLEENSYIQSEISSLLSSKENTKEKLKDLELELDMYRTRAEQAEAELDALHQAYTEKDSENRNMRKIVGRLPSLCGNYEKRLSSLQQNLQSERVESRKPSKLQRELSRLSSLEVALRSEMEVLKRSPPSFDDEPNATLHVQRSMEDINAELDRLESQTGELQDDNNILSVKLRLAVKEKEEMRMLLRKAEEEIQALREQRHQRRDQVQEDFSQESSETADDAQELEGDADSQDPRQMVAYHARPEAAGQLQVCESKLQGMRYEYGKQEDTIRGLEHSLSVAGNAVEAQKLRIMRLSARNEELVRAYHSKENEVQDLRVLSSTEAEGRRVCEQELNVLKEQAFKWKQEIRAQDLNCKVLKEKLSTKEAELEQRNDDVSALEHRRDWLEAEVKKLQRLLGEANQKSTALEHQCEEQKEKIRSLQVDVEGHVKELKKLKDYIPRLSKERDDLSHEAEQMGREALKLSAEVEVLRRKVMELDEDVMVRDGQITILCHSLEDLK